MPNRIIKESICRSDTIDSLSWFEEVLFYRLIVVCDDYGRFDGRTAIIKGSCFPLKDVTAKQIEDSLNKLVSAGLVRVYKSQGRPYLQMSTWEKHQQIRAAKSKFPSPDNMCMNLISDDINGNQQNTPDINGNQMKSGDVKCSRNRNRESINENRESESGNAHAVGQICHFEEFWSAYPNKQRRYLAENAYRDVIFSGKHTEEELVSAAENYSAHIKESGDKTFLPNNFLEKFVFEDYLEMQQKKAEPEDPEQEEEPVVEDEEWWKYGVNAWSD